MRGLVAIGVGIGVVAALAVVVVAFKAAQGPGEFPDDSPQAAIQGYLQAFDDADYEAAYAFFSSDVRALMSLEEFEQAARDYGMYAGDSRRVLYDSTRGTGDQVTLQLTVEVISGGLATDRYSYPTEVPMVREDGTWRLDQALVHLDPAPVPAPAPAQVD